MVVLCRFTCKVVTMDANGSNRFVLSCDHRDPDSVVLCVLATDEEDEDDIALQIHFTLLQAFCCENDINILRVSGIRRLAQVIGEPSEVENNNNTEPRDFHCILVTVSVKSSFCLLSPINRDS